MEYDVYDEPREGQFSPKLGPLKEVDMRVLH